MSWTLIKNEKDYQRALKRLEAIFRAKKGTKDGDEAELIALLIEHYENEHFPIDDPDPVEAIKFRMDQMGYRQSDLAKILGLKSRVSEILNRKRKLTLEMMRKLNKALGIPMDVLAADYQLKKKRAKTIRKNAVAAASSGSRKFLVTSNPSSQQKAARR